MTTRTTGTQRNSATRSAKSPVQSMAAGVVVEASETVVFPRPGPAALGSARGPERDLDWDATAAARASLSPLARVGNELLSSEH